MSSKKVINRDAWMAKEIGLVGGLFQNSDGRWLKVSIQRIGACDAIHVEKWEVYTVMHMTCRLGFTRLIIECDSTLQIDMV